jgi:alpha-glucosidase
VAAFQPIDRDHTEKGTADQEPWVGGPEQEAIRRRFIETRYRLLPYLYTLAEEATRTGQPMVRPLFLEFPDAAPDHHPIDLDKNASGEFLLGPELLIAAPPFPDEMGAYAAELPSPGWYDFWTGRKLAPPPALSGDPPDVPGRTTLPTVDIVPSFAQLPVFVRPGAILPMAPLVQSTEDVPQGPLTLRIYAGDSCSGTLYQDDGKSYAFRDGKYLRMNFTCRIDGKGLHLAIGPHQGTYPAWWKQIHAEVYGWTPKKNVALVNAGKVALQATQDGDSADLLIPDDGKGTEAEIR